jgi:hypothetical protein
MTNPPTTSLGMPGALPYPQDGYIQPTLGHGLRIWWAYYWPTTLLTLILTWALQSSLRAFLLAMLHSSPNFPVNLFMPILTYGGYVLNVIASLCIFRYVMGKRFRHFRIALLPTANPIAANEVSIGLERVMVIWWAFLWRSVVYSIAGYVVVILPLSWYVGMFRPSPQVATAIFGLIGALVGGAISLFVMYSSILDEDFSDVRVSLVSRNDFVPLPAATIPAASQVYPQP